MDRKFATSPTGHLVKTVNGADAFVPAPLPPRIGLDVHMTSVANASTALGELEGAARRLRNPELLLTPLQQREALTSSAAEGTFSTAEDLALLDADENAEARNDTREVLNYARALRFALAHVGGGEPITQWMIRTIHQTLMRRAGPDRPYGVKPGEYKVEQNFIGGRRGAIETARFVPPPPLVAAACMDDLERFVSRPPDRRMPALIEAALVHYQFETIHPFADGNGRVGRILIPVHMAWRGVSGARLLYVSPVIERRKDDYVEALYRVSRDGDWEGWIEFFLEAVELSSRNATGVIDRLIDLQDRYAVLARRLSQSSNLGALIDSLFERPVVTIPAVRDRLGVTYRSAGQLVERLCGAGVLKEAPGRSVKTYIATDIVRLSRGDYEDA